MLDVGCYPLLELICQWLYFFIVANFHMNYVSINLQIANVLTSIYFNVRGVSMFTISVNYLFFG